MLKIKHKVIITFLLFLFITGIIIGGCKMSRGTHSIDLRFNHAVIKSEMSSPHTISFYLEGLVIDEKPIIEERKVLEELVWNDLDVLWTIEPSLTKGINYQINENNKSEIPALYKASNRNKGRITLRDSLSHLLSSGNITIKVRVMNHKTKDSYGEIRYDLDTNLFQQKEHSLIKGSVMKEGWAVATDSVPKAYVIFKDSETYQTYLALTNQKGYYQLELEREGYYDIYVVADGYALAVLKHVFVDKRNGNVPAIIELQKVGTLIPSDFINGSKSLYISEAGMSNTLSAGLNRYVVNGVTRSIKGQSVKESLIVASDSEGNLTLARNSTGANTFNINLSDKEYYHLSAIAPGYSYVGKHRRFSNEDFRYSYNFIASGKEELKEELDSLTFDRLLAIIVTIDGFDKPGDFGREVLLGGTSYTYHASVDYLPAGAPLNFKWFVNDVFQRDGDSYSFTSPSESDVPYIISIIADSEEAKSRSIFTVNDNHSFQRGFVKQAHILSYSLLSYTPGVMVDLTKTHFSASEALDFDLKFKIRDLDHTLQKVSYTLKDKHNTNLVSVDATLIGDILTVSIPKNLAVADDYPLEITFLQNTGAKQKATYFVDIKTRKIPTLKVEKGNTSESKVLSAGNGFFFRQIFSFSGTIKVEDPDKIVKMVAYQVDKAGTNSIVRKTNAALGSDSTFVVTLPSKLGAGNDYEITVFLADAKGDNIVLANPKIPVHILESTRPEIRVTGLSDGGPFDPHAVVDIPYVGDRGTFKGSSFITPRGNAFTISGDIKDKDFDMSTYAYRFFGMKDGHYVRLFEGSSTISGSKSISGETLPASPQLQNFSLNFNLDAKAGQYSGQHFLLVIYAKDAWGTTFLKTPIKIGGRPAASVTSTTAINIHLQDAWRDSRNFFMNIPDSTILNGVSSLFYYGYTITR